MRKAFELTARDYSRMSGLHPDLVRVVERLASFTTVPFFVIEGVRSMARQRKLLESGASWTLDSRHLTGHAIDIAPKSDSWAWPMYHQLAPQMKQAAKLEGVALDWGGDWWRKKDGPHWELRWSKYPKSEVFTPWCPIEEAKVVVETIQQRLADMGNLEERN